MPAASLSFTLKTVSDAAIDDRVRFEFLPSANSAGGQHMRTPEFALNGALTCRVNGLSCLDVGTLYQVSLETRKYQPVRFFRRIVPGDQIADPLALLIDPSNVKGIGAPEFGKLEVHLQSVLNQSQIPLLQANSGEELYKKLSDLQKACLLNIATKANHPTADSIWPQVQSIVRIQQDRFFANVRGGLKEIVQSSSCYTEVSNLLHEPMPGFQKDKSFKSKGEHATLQVTFMRSGEQLAADMDIDEASGIEHTFEVIRNAFQGLTNPYQVHELMLLGGADTKVTPPYQLVC